MRVAVSYFDTNGGAGLVTVPLEELPEILAAQPTWLIREIRPEYRIGSAEEENYRKIYRTARFLLGNSLFNQYS